MNEREIWSDRETGAKATMRELPNGDVQIETIATSVEGAARATRFRELLHERFGGATEDDRIAVLLDPENARGGHGPWVPETVDRHGVWLTDDDGCSLLVDDDDVAALVNQAVRRASYRLD